MARIRELLQSWRGWQRRAWDLGTILALREGVEAADWVGRHVLSPASLAWYSRESLLPRLKTDAAIGDGRVRAEFNKLLNQPINPATRSQRSLALLADLAEDGYLERWRDILVSGDFHVERAARCIAAHVLDVGLHPDFVWSQISTGFGATTTAADLVELFMKLEAAGHRAYEGLVVLQGKVPAAPVASESAHWISREIVAARLEKDQPQVDRAMVSGGLIFVVQARDPISALHEITERFDRIRNRVRYSRSTTPLDVFPQIFLSGVSTPQPFRRGDSAVSIASLEKNRILYESPKFGTDGSLIDDALELAAGLTESSPSKAVAGAWSALESLLFCDTDDADREESRAVSADRAAALVTAGWPRAELTTLSYDRQVLACNDRLAAQLSGVASNKERCRVMLGWLASGPAVPTADPATVAAFHRMRELSAQPGPTLSRINKYVRGSMRRLYRQRNIVLHGGSTRSVALPATIRTAGPLVGAALDRIVHGYAATQTTPLQLASRAELALRLAGHQSGWRLHELLGE
ncbi:hypothetical protein [Herbidospora sp. RD11066]